MASVAVRILPVEVDLRSERSQKFEAVSSISPPETVLFLCSSDDDDRPVAAERSLRLRCTRADRQY